MGPKLQLVSICPPFLQLVHMKKTVPILSWQLKLGRYGKHGFIEVPENSLHCLGIFMIVVNVVIQTNKLPGVFSYVIQLANHMRNIGTDHFESDFLFSHYFKPIFVLVFIRLMDFVGYWFTVGHKAFSDRWQIGIIVCFLSWWDIVQLSDISRKHF